MQTVVLDESYGCRACKCIIWFPGLNRFLILIWFLVCVCVNMVRDKLILHPLRFDMLCVPVDDVQIRKPLKDVCMYKCLPCKWCKRMLVSLGRVKWLALCGARMVFDGHGLRVCAEVGNSKLWAGVWSSWLEADRETRLLQFSIKWLRERPRLARGLMHPQCFI